jgi:hypothetical protein
MVARIVEAEDDLFGGGEDDRRRALQTAMGTAAQAAVVEKMCEVDPRAAGLVLGSLLGVAADIRIGGGGEGGGGGGSGGIGGLCLSIPPSLNAASRSSAYAAVLGAALREEVLALGEGRVQAGGGKGNFHSRSVLCALLSHSTVVRIGFGGEHVDPRRV